MQNIALPKKIEFNKGKKENEAVVVVEPCYPGYGITLGNSLRRVLLSSLPGAAVVGVKIEGTDHEFTTLPHVKEDILETVLNIKQLRLKVFSDEVVKLELEAHGEKEVKASDIKKNSQVEITNPDLVIARITDMAGSLKMEIFVSNGRGYVTIENREQGEKEIGYIEVDSFFSPVLTASTNVENVRVGKMTNWDKLSLQIITDGTITPEDAFKQAAGILIEQFNALVGKDSKGIDEEKKSKDKTEAEDKIKISSKEEKEERSSEEDEQPNDIGEGEKPKKKRGRPKKIS